MRHIFFSITILIAFALIEVSHAGECNDNVDNDGDSLIDWQYDLGCYGPNDPTEGVTTSGELDNGWTVFRKSIDTRIVYISSSDGDDTADGLTPATAVKSFAAAKALMRHGFPDWLLLKRGDIWVDDKIGAWKTSGRSLSEPQVIATYGDSTARPLLEFGTQSGTGFYCNGGGGTPENLSHIFLIGIHFKVYSRDHNDPRFTGLGPSCLQWLRDGGNFHVEDNKFEFGQVNIQSNPILPITLRRNVMTNNYSITGHAQCIFTNAGNVDLILEENLLNHGGWSDDFRLSLYGPNDSLTEWQSISDGRFCIQLEGTAYDIDNLIFSGATSMVDVAQILEDGINSKVGIPNAVNITWTLQGKVFMLQSDTFTSDPGYGISVYQGLNGGTDLNDSLWLNENSQGVPEATIFNRNAYLNHGKGKTQYIRNIDANGASGGVQIREGGITDNNLFLRNPHAIIYGHKGNDPGNVGGTSSNNVVLGSRNIDTQVQGTGILITSSATSNYGSDSLPSLIRNLKVYNNIIAHNEFGTFNFKAIGVQGDGIHENLNIYDNIIYDWSNPNWPDSNDHRATGFVLQPVTGSINNSFHDNIIQQPVSGYVASINGSNAAGFTLTNNSYFSAEDINSSLWSKGWFGGGNTISMDEWITRTGETNMNTTPVSFPDPNRKIEGYMSSIGGTATYEAFINEAKQQSKYNWRPEYTAAAVNDWVRAGFGMATPVKKDVMQNLNIHPTINIFPNPASSITRITFTNSAQNAGLEVFSLSGKKIFSINSFIGNEMILDTREYPTGIYMVQLRIGKDTHNVLLLVP